MRTIHLKKLTFLISGLLVLHAQGQVTIGSNNAPNKGALLDLKETVDGNSNKGLILPRVALNSLTTTVTDLKITINGSVGSIPWDINEHIGLMVYNTNEDRCAATPIYKGLYVWNGQTWQYLGQTNQPSPSVYKVSDPRDSEVYLARSFGAAGDWMLENIRYDPIIHPYTGFTGFTHTANSAVSPYTNKYFAYAEGDTNPYIPANHPSSDWRLKIKNGLLYNWAAATNGENPSVANQGQTPTGTDPVASVQGICPNGWHVPSDKEWNDLERHIYNNAHLYSSYSESEKNVWVPWETVWEYGTSFPGYGWRPSSTATDAQGAAIKSVCPPNGSSTVTNGKSFSALLGGFNALLAGYASGGSTGNYGYGCFFWSSSSSSNSNAWFRNLTDSNASVYRFENSRSFMFFVRCKKN